MHRSDARRLCGFALLIALLVCVPVLAVAEIEFSEIDRVAQLRSEAAAYEHGDGVEQDGPRAAASYCHAARLGDAASAFDLGWMYANGRGVARDDALAAVFFGIAADHGIEQAKNMLQVLDRPAADLPDCLRVVVVQVAETAAAPIEEKPADVAANAAPVIDRPQIRAPAPLVEMVQRAATEYQVPVPLVLAIIKAESNFDSAAVSPKNAQGLMQLMPDTATRFRVKDPFDPAQNIRGGVSYLRWLLAYFEGEVDLVAAAYNAGERTVERYGGVPPYAETRAYVRRILATVGAVAQPFDAKVVEPSPHLHRIRERR